MTGPRRDAARAGVVHVGQPPRRRWLFFCALAVLLVGFTLLVDRALGVLGIPDDHRVGPPPRYETEVRNIEYAYHLRTNDRGLRYPTLPLAKPPGVVRVVVLGDSFTEGTGVSEEQRYTDLLQARFRRAGGPRVEFINCAEGGTDPYDYAQKLFLNCIDYQPDAVLIGLFANDVANTEPGADPSRISRERTGLRRFVHRAWPHAYMLLWSALHRREGLAWRRDPAPSFLDVVREELSRRGIPEQDFRRWRELVPDELVAAADEKTINRPLLTYPLTRPAYYRDGLDVESPTARAKLAAVLRILDAIRSRCEAAGAELAIVLIPDRVQYDPRAPESLTWRLFDRVGLPMRTEWLTETTALQHELTDWAARQRVPLRDLCPSFREAARRGSPTLTYAFDGHWTAAGHELAAAALYEWLATGEVFSRLAGAAAAGTATEEPSAAGDRRR